MQKIDLKNKGFIANGNPKYPFVSTAPLRIIGKAESGEDLGFPTAGNLMQKGKYGAKNGELQVLAGQPRFMVNYRFIFKIK